MGDFTFVLAREKVTATSTTPLEDFVDARTDRSSGFAGFADTDRALVCAAPTIVDITSTRASPKRC